MFQSVTLKPFNEFANLFLSFGTFKLHTPSYIIVLDLKNV